MKHGATKRSYPRSLALMLGIGALAGVLLWAKLRLVSNVPRSVYADPKAAGRASPGAAPSAGQQHDATQRPSPSPGTHK